MTRVAAKAVGRPFSSKDPRGQFLRELGYKPAAQIDKLAGKTFGTEVAKERVDLLDVDRLFLLIDAPARKKLDGDELFNRLTSRVRSASPTCRITAAASWARPSRSTRC